MLAEPRLDWGDVLRGHWLGGLNILGKLMLGTLGLRLLPVTLEGAIVMFQLDVLCVKVFVFLEHLGDAGPKELYLCLEIDIC